MRAAIRQRAAVLEPLENRWFFSVSVDANGFTSLTPAAGAKVVYVSASSGNDANSGLSSASPVRTLSKGESLLRDDSADELLLKAGDTWNTPFPQWTKSGESAADPMYIGSYGSGAAPLILTGDVSSAFSTTGTTPVNDLVINGIQFRSDARDPASPDFSSAAARNQDSGFRWYAPTDDLLIQDCSFQYYTDNLDIEGMNGPISGVTLNGVQSLDSYVNPYGGFRSQGLYGYNLNGITIEDSLFNHDGWNSTVPDAGQSGYDHDIYLASTVQNAVVENNILANASDNGLLARGGGDIENNFFLDDPSAISFGASPGSTSVPGGVSGEIVNNVIMGDSSLGSVPYGYGITIANTAPGTPTLVAGNIFTGDTQQSKPAIDLMSVGDTKDPQDCVGINDLTIQNNLFNNWYRPLEIESSLVPGSTGATALNGLSIRDNNFQNAGDYLVRYDASFSPSAVNWSGNTYADSRDGNWFEVDGVVMDLQQWVAKVDPTGIGAVTTYPDASATEATYDATLGGAGTDAAFFSAEEAQQPASWNPALDAGALNDYLRTAFALPTAPVAVASAVSITDSTLVSTAAVLPDLATPADATAAQPYTFSVTYTDTNALDDASIASGNVAVTGPDAFDESATLVGTQAGADGTSAVATYAITPPAGDWTGVDDGAYSIVMQADQVRNADGLPVQQGAIGSFAVELPVVINGTAGNDTITAKVVKQNVVVTVNKVATSYPLAYLPALEINTGAGNDHVSIAAHVMPVVIQCGDGNDVVQTVNGQDTLIAGAGKDTLTASGGYNQLIGGSGNDLLRSGTGPNLLYGGTGNSRLNGGSGQDVLIAGSGTDRLQAGSGNQLLIAGVPASTAPTDFSAILAAWANDQPYTARLAALEPAGNVLAAGTELSIAGISFAPTNTVDSVIGGSHPDWFVTSSTDKLANKRITEARTALD